MFQVSKEQLKNLNESCVGNLVYCEINGRETYVGQVDEEQTIVITKEEYDKAKTSKMNWFKSPYEV